MSEQTEEILTQGQVNANEDSPERPRIVIGSLTKDNTGSIPTIALAFITGLERKYDYRPHYAKRSYGLTRTSRFNFFNAYYFFKHLGLWIVALIRHRPHIVHYPVTSGWNLEKSMIFLLLPRVFGIRTVGHLNGGAFNTFWDRLPGWRRSLGAWCIRNLDVFLVTSKGWSDWAQRVVGVQPDRLATVINPIDGTFETAALSFALTNNTDLFFVGAIGQRKGVFDILEVATRLSAPDFHGTFHIAGPEDRAGDLEKVEGILAQKKVRNVKLWGPLYGNDKIEYFREHGIFLFPTYNENFPLVVIEAAAAGKPIVTTPVGALPEFFKNGESLLFVQPGNIDSIVQAIERLQHDGQLRTRLSKGAREVFRSRLTREIILKSMDAVYRRLLDSRSAGDERRPDA